MYRVGFNDLLIKQLEIIKRPATLLVTHALLTINLPKLSFRLSHVKRLCYKICAKNLQLPLLILIE